MVNGVSVSKPQQSPMQAGDFYFRPTLIQHVTIAPWYRRWFLGEKTQVTHEPITCIVLSCPQCGLPFGFGPAWRRNRGEEGRGTAGGENALGGLALRVKLPMAGGVFVGRVEDGGREEVVDH